MASVNFKTTIFSESFQEQTSQNNKLCNAQNDRITLNHSNLAGKQMDNPQTTPVWQDVTK